MIVYVSDPQNAGAIISQEMTLDTGSTATFLPLDVLLALGLPSVGLASVEDFNGVYHMVETFRANVLIPNVHNLNLTVYATASAEGLLGLDFLNALIVTFDGPSSAVRI